MKRKLIKAVGITGCVLFSLPIIVSTSEGSKGPAQTAQSIMIELNYSKPAYQIEGTVEWSFDRGTPVNPGCAMNAYNNTWDGKPPTMEGKGCTPNQYPAAPPPDQNELMQHAQSERCIFFCGGLLSNKTYQKSLNVIVHGKGPCKYTYTYIIQPKDSYVNVNPRTCWNSTYTGGMSINATFEGFACSESFQILSNRYKYSFTMVNPDGSSRVRNLQVELQKLVDGEWVTVQGPMLVKEADPETGIVPISSATSNFTYFGNAGKFGKATVYLHADGGKSPNDVVSILRGINDNPNADNFFGNDNDLEEGKVHIARFSGEWVITEAGTYRTVVTGILKGNEGEADFEFSVSSNLIEIGGCNCL